MNSHIIYENKVNFTKILNWILAVLALCSLASIILWIGGGFSTAHIFQRSITDWSFVWMPGLFDNLLLFLAFILAVIKWRACLIFVTIYLLNDLVINFQVLFGGGLIAPDFLTYVGEAIYLLFFPLVLVGIILWGAELWQKGRVIFLK